MHICRGYPNKPLERRGISYKANQAYYRDILSWLSASKLDVVSIEGAASKLDLSILGAIGKKTVMLGVVDVGDNGVESVEAIVERARQALRYLPKGQLILAPDCGMLELTRASARQKLVNLALAAREVNERRRGEARHLQHPVRARPRRPLRPGADRRRRCATPTSSRCRRSSGTGSVPACVDEPAALAAHLPDHHWVYGANLDMDASHRDAAAGSSIAAASSAR